MATNAQGQIVPNAQGTGWKVTSQQQTFGIGGNGQAVQGVTVYFTTATGVESSVFLPEAQYNPTNVRAAIAAKAGQLDEVSGMTG